jgi:hypothetical protein
VDQRDVTPLLSKVILFRSGGFGDILLTIPVLSILEIKFREVMLCVPGKYHFLIKEFSSRILLFDLDEGEDQIIKHASGATLLSFWDDPEWIKKWEDAGVSQTYIFNPRPQKGEHFTKSIIDRLGGSVSRFDLDRIWLMPKNNIPSTISGDLWIHPGSGSSDKNLALSSFLNFAEQWLDKQEENRVFFSLGEADSSIMTKLNKTHYLNSTRIDFCIFESLESFYCKLVKHTGPFISNDTGPSHLAAMLGLQTHTFFKSTRPDIWAPLGPNVKIYCADSVPKRIL